MLMHEDVDTVTNTTKSTTGQAISRLIPGTRDWYAHYRERANTVQREKLQQQILLPDEDRNSGTSESQVGCNNVVVPPGAPSTDRGDDDA